MPSDSERAGTPCVPFDWTDLMLEPPVFTALSETWSDYAVSPGRAGDGGGVYADFTVNGGTATTTRWYELGIGKVDNADTVPRGT